MPGMYPPGEYDLAGFAVGAVEKDRIIDGRAIRPGDAVIGLASSGPHSNGYSLIRRILELRSADLASDLDGRSLADALMAPTRIYVRSLLGLMNAVSVKGMAHITGGGLLENIPRCLPPQAKAVLARSAWPLPPVFAWLQDAGNVATAEMQRTFNCGVGMAVIVASQDADRALAHLRSCDESAWVIGKIEARLPGETQTQVR
jgi:phosphoribosylformylglycinamidine cyclo-ligase